MKRVLEREEEEPLFIREEQSNPMVVVGTHKLVANDPKFAPRYLYVQEQVVTVEDIFRLLGDDSQQAFQRRWNTLPYSLKIKEYHSPNRMKDALERVPMYKKTLQRLKVKWIGLKLSPPFILGMLEGRKEEEERK